MNLESTIKDSNGRNHTGLIRLGGIAMLFGFTIHAVANWVVKTFPSEDFSSSELQAYLLEEAGNWAIVHGIRYMAVVCIVLFAAGLFVRTCCIRSTATTGWGIVGLVGCGMMVVNFDGYQWDRNPGHSWISIDFHDALIHFGHSST